MSDSNGPQPPPINPNLRAQFGHPLVQKAVSLLQKDLAIVIPEDGFQHAYVGKGPTGISIQIVCVVTGRDAGIWTFEIWGKPDGTWEHTYKNKQGSSGRPV